MSRAQTLLLAGAAGGIQITNLGSNATNTGTTVTLSSVTVPAGSLIVLLTVDSGGAGGTLSDGGTNTYTADNQATAQIGNWTFWYKENCTALSGATLTYTKAASGDGAISAFYASGIATASSLDATVTVKQNGATGTTTSPTITSNAPAASGELFVAALWTVVGTGLTFTQDSGNGWATASPFIQATTVNSDGGVLSYKVNTGSSALTHNPTWNNATRWANSIYGFKHA